MDIVSYALSKKIAEHAVSGVQSMSVEGQNLIINTKDSGVLTMTFPTPKDGVSVADIDVNANNQIVFTMSDGSEFISGKIPTVKGDAGFSPTITENADNTDKIYKLDITTADSTFTTPNLKGGAGGSGEENKIDSISVNGVNIVPDENKNVDITVPTVTNDLTDELKSSYDDAVTAKHTHDNKTVLDNITAEKVESWDKAEENVQSDWNETDDTADGFIKNKPTIPDAYDDTALSGRVDNVETSIGDMSTIEVKSVSDLVSAINVLYNAFMSSINYADKKLTITYRNGGTVDIDMSAIITDTNIGELSNIDDTGITDKQILSYDTATNKYIPTTINTAGVLADAKKYTDDEIAKINNADAISVDEKPIYSNGTITYKKDGVEKTITDGDFWFFYIVDNMAYQTIWIDGVEFTTSVDGSVDFKDFVSKTNDLTSTYTGEETDKTKVTTIASLDALYAIISTALGKKVNTADIVDNLFSDATDKPLSAAQGKALDTKISNFVTTVEEDYAKTADIPTTLPANGGNADTVNNHTVETDIPVDAVFTDTIYDDTKIQKKVSDNGYGEISGGKNLFNGKYIQSVLTSEVDYTNRNLYNEFPSVSDITGLKYLIFGRYFKKGIYTFSYSNNNFLSLNRIAIAGSSCVISSNVIRRSYTWTQDVDGYTYFTIEADESETSTTDILFKGTPDIQIEEGSVATKYEPYFQSNKMLTEEVSAQNENLDSQGLLNKFDGKLEQGYKNASGTIMWDSTNVCIKNTISVSSRDKVTVKLDSVATRLYTIYRNNGVFVSEEINYNTNNVTVTIPSGANGLDITMVYDSTTTPSQVGNLYVYINNAIEELKNDLDGLEYSENAGGKNLVLNTVYGFIAVDNKVNIDNSSTSYIFYAQAGKTYSFSGDETPTAQSVRFAKVSSINPKTQEPVSDFNSVADGVSTFTTNETGYYMLYVYNTKTSGIKFQIEEGTQATPYEPYIPSVKMLAEKTTQIDDLNVLGWVVPEEMPIKNYTDSDGVFHQRVGRVDLGGLSFIYIPSANRFYVKYIGFKADNAKTANCYCNKYKTVPWNDYAETSSLDKVIALETSGYIGIRDISYNTDVDALKTAMKGVYLYYELAEEKTISVDGNEAVTQIKNDLAVKPLQCIALQDCVIDKDLSYKIGNIFFVCVSFTINSKVTNWSYSPFWINERLISNTENALGIYINGTNTNAFIKPYSSGVSLVVENLEVGSYIATGMFPII